MLINLTDETDKILEKYNLTKTDTRRKRKPE